MKLIRIQGKIEQEKLFCEGKYKQISLHIYNWVFFPDFFI